MFLALWLLQEAPADTSGNTTTMIRYVAGALALVLIVIILLRRKRKASKEDWT
jgi:LPXTG-motif cell wall-anchored protein